MLAQGRFWRASLAKTRDMIHLEVLKGALPEDLQELQGLRIDVPLERWNRLVKHVYSDRKLLGGLLLDFAKSKERVSSAAANDRLLAELRRVVLDATAVLVGDEVLVLASPESSEA